HRRRVVYPLGGKRGRNRPPLRELPATYTRSTGAPLLPWPKPWRWQRGREKPIVSAPPGLERRQWVRPHRSVPPVETWPTAPDSFRELGRRLVGRRSPRFRRGRCFVDGPAGGP